MRKSKKALAEKMAKVVSLLKELYPNAECALTWGGTDPWRLLVMGRLSAQCTDKRVNIVCEDLFRVYPTALEMANADLGEVEALVKPCGLFRTKANDIKNASIMLLEQYGGVVPDTMEELLKLPGIGRKTANLILSDVYGQPAIVADTHCIRISNKLGLTTKDCGKDPYKVEMALKKVIEPTEQASLCHRFVHFGRDICTARNPQCPICPLNHLCSDHLIREKKANKA